ncbi:pro-resilin-like, partial [Pollicipes pollicipes]|uniref:pro-resilin-like n=1 Tax=Pollicipes pollicipes TaxID=41117 RepID=UPI0018853D08
SQYGSSSASSGYGLQSRRRPFESSLKPTYGQQSNGGYGQQSSGGYSQQSNGGYSQQSNGGYSQQSSGGYSQQSSGGYGQQSNGGYGQQSSGGYGQQSYGGYGQQSNGGYGQTEPPTPYSFSYDVLDVRGNDFGAAEESNGEEVQGQYSVVLPDGRLQTVSYSVQGDSGFVADVEYEGEAKFFNAYGEEEGRSNVKRGRGPTGGQGYGSSQGSAYDVLDVRGNDFGAAEESNGEEVQGQYSVVLPDGRLQTVSYSVEGDSGFVADVEYEGEAKFFNAYGEEEGRSNVKRGRGPTGGDSGFVADVEYEGEVTFFNAYGEEEGRSNVKRGRGPTGKPPTPYSFSYDVLDVRGNDFGAAEESNGEEVQGQYSVVLPDGRLQTVSYSVQGESGFVADVEYEGEAKFLNAATWLCGRLEYEGEAKFFNAYGEEEGRSNVKRGRGPTGGQGYGSSQGSATVSYSVQGDSGFVADIEYEGEAKFFNAYGEEEGRSNVKTGRDSGFVADVEYEGEVTFFNAYREEQGRSNVKRGTWPDRNYDVLDVRGNDFGAAEESNGEEVQGQYSVVLPDGRLQTISYSVQGESGFVADVEYEGEAKFLNAYGEEEGRSNVKRGRGPTGGQGYGSSQGSAYGK